MQTTCSGFRCDDGQCLTRHEWHCDGNKDCNDGSDELHCSPDCELADGKFLCKSDDECIPLSRVCDGNSDCSDKSDEGGFCNKTESCEELKCDLACQVLPTGAVCTCKKGLEFNKATKKCEVSS